jgi:hypothetical protein
VQEYGNCSGEGGWFCVNTAVRSRAGSGLCCLQGACLPVASAKAASLLCPDYPLLAVGDQAKRVFVPAPHYHAGGIAGVGKAGFHIPASALPPSAHGDGLGWSLSFWLWVWDHPNGDFRCLFQKGHGGDNRTPSAWFAPSDMRLALRVSSPTDANLGAESLNVLPVRKWMHVAFVFQNDTTTDGTSQLSYYINGQLDVTLYFNQAIVANDGPLRIGRDTWERGTRMLVSEVKVFSTALTSNSVDLEFRSGLELHAVTFWRASLKSDVRRGEVTPQLMRLMDGIFRACEMVSTWPPTTATPSDATGKASSALLRLDSCEVDYVSAMEARLLFLDVSCWYP